MAVSVLLNEQKDGLVDWLKGVLSKAVSNRKAWEDEHAARRMLEEVSLEETEAVKESEGTAPSISEKIYRALA